MELDSPYPSLFTPAIQLIICTRCLPMQVQIQKFQKEGAEIFLARAQHRSITTTHEHPWLIEQHHLIRDGWLQKFYRKIQKRGVDWGGRPPSKSTLAMFLQKPHIKIACNFLNKKCEPFYIRNSMHRVKGVQVKPET